jgi:glyoxylase-like metal-dependent hydrolase (beta-lactamase superfamily II)
MAYEVNEIAGGVYAILIWDPSWSSFNNCYVINREDGVLMIDSCKAEQSDELLAALSQVGVNPKSVKAFLATHGHQDHIGGSDLFDKAEKWIHVREAGRLSETQRAKFKLIDCDEGELWGLSFTLLGHHTAGSIALFDPVSHCLFCGDHICFFGDKLPPEGILTFGHELRVKTAQFIEQWSKSPEDRSKYRFDQFVNGLEKLAHYDARLLGTGHGPVLHEQITDFLRSLITA